MTKEILKITKIVFVLQAIVGVIFGLFFVFGAEMMFEIYNWPYNAPVFSRLLGMDFIALAFLLLLSYRENEWEKVKNIVIYMIVWTVLNSIAFIVLHIIFALPILNLTNIVQYIIFAVLYCYIFIQQRK
ncbi:MAG: hypothetical protein ACFE9I_01490 [Candidatus Hermodarchaeota archaeon]